MVRSIEQLLRKRGIVTNHIPSAQFRPPSVTDGKWLSREDAVRCLKIWAEHNIPRHNLYYSVMSKTEITSGVEHAYLTGMIEQLIELVRESDEDPVSVVYGYYQEMDDLLSTSDDDHFITHRVAGYLENAAHDVLLFLKEIEKEMNRE